MKKLKILISVFMLLLYSTIYAELSPGQLSFTTLLSSAELVANGKIIQIIRENNNYLMTFEIKNMIKGEANTQILNIISPLANGFYLPDEAYLEEDTSHIIFLNIVDGNWRIVNGGAGVFKTDYNADIKEIVSLFDENTNSFSNINIKHLFNSVQNEEIQSRIVYDLDNYLSKNDSSFLMELLKSNKKRSKIFSISKLGKLRIISARIEIEKLLQNNDDPQIQFHCIIALGELGNENSSNLIIPYLSHPKQGMRRAAIHACGKVNGLEIINSLISMYEQEQNVTNRLAIIESLTRIQSQENMKTMLQYLQSMETNSIILSILNRKIKG